MDLLPLQLRIDWWQNGWILLMSFNQKCLSLPTGRMLFWSFFDQKECLAIFQSEVSWFGYFPIERCTVLIYPTMNKQNVFLICLIIFMLLSVSLSAATRWSNECALQYPFLQLEEFWSNANCTNSWFQVVLFQAMFINSLTKFRPAPDQASNHCQHLCPQAEYINCVWGW